MEGLALPVAMFCVVVLVVGLILVTGLLRRRERTIARLRSIVGGTTDEVVVDHARSLADVAGRAADDTERARRDRGRLLDLLGTGIIRLDGRRRIELANPAAHVLLDRPPGALEGMTATAAFLDARMESLLGATARAGTANDEVDIGGSGTRLVVRARRTEDGGMWILLEDVSELRRLQRIRAEFIDNLSHELRTPLTTVTLLAETLAREAIVAGDGVPPKMRDRIAKIEVETGHLVQMVDELLELSRIEGGGPIVLLDDVDLVRVAVDTTERLRLFAERQGVRLAVEPGPDVPPIRGDADRLGQVLVNLLHNAVKFSPDGGVVTVSVHRDGATVVTSVEDHGIGIPRVARDRIFERFYKVDRARARGTVGGTGLGLAIARHVIEQHGGTIRVASEEGVGSTFTFVLPVAPASPAG